MKNMIIVVLMLMLTYTSIQLIHTRRELQKAKSMLTTMTETFGPAWLELPITKDEMKRIGE